ncbi:unnamed protein product [Adineta ricciae]|uniref:Uncharacterized protein n=1 Tax=Adineta ricciae TaxID=249248 RepID=A0A814I5U3_ADIRI|nr:unnamed protein product [Adineta ricciae]CAF1284484.1 unnamed protein product [Adineta ricciae]
MNYSNVIYVGNVQSIDDKTLREYFQRFGDIEEFFHNCTRAADEWLIDYRFIRFSPETDINVFLTNKIDHTICRIRLDIHSYDAAFHEDARLMLDRKVCIAHTNPRLDRNVIKKAFTRYGRILNCTCVSSGNGVEYVYIEFDSINSVRSVFASGQTHFAGRTSLAVKPALRPSQVGIKVEQNLPANSKDWYRDDQLKPVKNAPQPISRALSTSCNVVDQQQIKDLEREYNVIIQKDFDEITYQIDKYLRKQREKYRQFHEYIRPTKSR